MTACLIRKTCPSRTNCVSHVYVCVCVCVKVCFKISIPNADRQFFLFEEKRSPCSSIYLFIFSKLKYVIFVLKTNQYQKLHQKAMEHAPDIYIVLLFKQSVPPSICPEFFTCYTLIVSSCLDVLLCTPLKLDLLDFLSKQSYLLYTVMSSLASCLPDLCPEHSPYQKFLAVNSKYCKFAFLSYRLR